MAALLLTSMVAQAQYRAQDANGNVLKKITFDREQVTEVRSDGSAFNAGSPLVVNRVMVSDTATVGIEEVRAEMHQQPAEYYDVMGRRVSDIEKMQSGIYLMKEGTKVRKIVKMR